MTEQLFVRVTRYLIADDSPSRWATTKNPIWMCGAETCDDTSEYDFRNEKYLCGGKVPRNAHLSVTHIDTYTTHTIDDLPDNIRAIYVTKVLLGELEDA